MIRSCLEELRAGTAVVGILPLAISVLGEQQIPRETIWCAPQECWSLLLGRNLSTSRLQ
jgi:hypothetical protein